MLSIHRAMYFSSLCAGMATDRVGFMTPNRDRKKPLDPSLPHHRAYGSRTRRFNEYSYRPTKVGSPKLLKYRTGSASASAGVIESRHGPCADLLVFHASRTETPR